MRPVSIANNHSGNGTGTTGAAGATGTTTTGSDTGLSPWLLRAFKVQSVAYEKNTERML